MHQLQQSTVIPVTHATTIINVRSRFQLFVRMNNELALIEDIQYIGLAICYRYICMILFVCVLRFCRCLVLQKPEAVFLNVYFQDRARLENSPLLQSPIRFVPQDMAQYRSRIALRFWRQGRRNR